MDAQERGGSAGKGPALTKRESRGGGLLSQQDSYKVSVLLVLNGIFLIKTSPQAPTLLSSQAAPLTLLFSKERDLPFRETHSNDPRRRNSLSSYFRGSSQPRDSR